METSIPFHSYVWKHKTGFHVTGHVWQQLWLLQVVPRLPERVDQQCVFSHAIPNMALPSGEVPFLSCPYSWNSIVAGLCLQALEASGDAETLHSCSPQLCLTQNGGGKLAAKWTTGSLGLDLLFCCGGGLRLDTLLHKVLPNSCSLFIPCKPWLCLGGVYAVKSPSAVPNTTKASR